MDEREIIEGLMLMLADENINVMKLSKRIGFKKYKKFDKALRAAIELTEAKDIKTSSEILESFAEFINEAKSPEKKAFKIATGALMKMDLEFPLSFEFDKDDFNEELDNIFREIESALEDSETKDLMFDSNGDLSSDTSDEFQELFTKSKSFKEFSNKFKKYLDSKEYEVDFGDFVYNDDED